MVGPRIRYPIQNLIRSWTKYLTLFVGFEQISYTLPSVTSAFAQFFWSWKDSFDHSPCANFAFRVPRLFSGFCHSRNWAHEKYRIVFFQGSHKVKRWLMTSSSHILTNPESTNVWISLSRNLIFSSFRGLSFSVIIDSYIYSKWNLVGYSGGSHGLENVVKRWGRQIEPIFFSVYFDISL